MAFDFFIGREKEFKFLESLYKSNKFEMLILHGRRRVGKSFLLSHFARIHRENAVYFTADKSSEKSNVRSFCKELNNTLNMGDFAGAFTTWKEVYSFIEGIEIKERLIIIIDEFTYLYNSNKAFDSELQNAIDNIFKNKNIFLVLCGSEVSVIEELFDSQSKPLYGRKTADLKLLPFTYNEARKFFPKYSNEEALTAYSILGGIPLYLSLFDDNLSIEENVIINCLSTTGYLFDEVDTVLRMELNETHLYKEIMLAINSGASTFSSIREQIDEVPAKISKYINVLIDLGFIKREVPCGEKEKTRNTLYSIADNYFAFYFMFIYKHINMLNGLISPALYYKREVTKEKLNAFIEHRFGEVCETYLKEKFYNGEMPFYAEQLGRWWGPNTVKKRSEEIDIVALDDENALFAECKYRESPFGEKQLKDLLDSSLCINRKNKYYVIFSKKGITDSVRSKIEGDSSYMVFDINNLYSLQK